jgi:hypothetical protein
MSIDFGRVQSTLSRSTDAPMLFGKMTVNNHTYTIYSFCRVSDAALKLNIIYKDHLPLESEGMNATTCPKITEG